MKIFIIYASAGAGHQRASEAIYNYLRLNNENLELKLIDVLKKSNILFRNTYSLGYAFIVSYAPWLWTAGFYITYIKLWHIVIKGVRFVVNRLNTKNFAKFLSKENPDIIISTHFLPSEVSAYLKRTKKINSKLITVITDFGIHPFWLSEGTNIYVAASNFSKRQLVLRGIEENKIKEFGIPIDIKFSKKYGKLDLYKKFNLDQNKFTALITTGSFSIGPIEKIVDLLYKEIQILVVCAHNIKLYKRLKSKNYPNVSVFRFIDNIQELMAISDIIITKPGGLTISESLAMDLAPIFVTAIPGQETENIKVLAHNGIGIYARDTHALKNIILDLKENPHKLNIIKENIAKLKKPYATEELCRALC
jgi:processive 1,2-diacylglycerol beta-glucosyltransferase